jgi:DNA replication protein DnaC
VCKDTGWELKSDGSYKRCQCFEKEKLKRMWERSGIKLDQRNLTFGTYEANTELTKKAKAAAVDYYKKFKAIEKNRQNSIAFMGQVGSGKTHLSIAIALNFIDKGTETLYMPYRDIITSLKQNMIDEEYYQNQVNKYKRARVLLIDDLFKGKLNATDINIMFEIINHRYLNQLPLIISTEFTADKLLDFDEAIGSRILEMCKDYTVELIGRENNYRLRGVL